MLLQLLYKKDAKMGQKTTGLVACRRVNPVHSPSRDVTSAPGSSGATRVPSG